MSQFVQPFFGDVILDGVGATGCLFVFFLIWQACKEWRIRIRREKRARERATGR